MKQPWFPVMQWFGFFLSDRKSYQRRLTVDLLIWHFAGSKQTGGSVDVNTSIQRTEIYEIHASLRAASWSALWLWDGYDRYSSLGNGCTMYYTHAKWRGRMRYKQRHCRSWENNHYAVLCFVMVSADSLLTQYISRNNHKKYTWSCQTIAKFIYSAFTLLAEPFSWSFFWAVNSLKCSVCVSTFIQWILHSDSIVRLSL